LCALDGLGDGHRRQCPLAARENELDALNLAASRLRYVAGSDWSTRRYLNMDLLKGGGRCRGMT
jgi:hypothetical protein